MEDKAAVKVAIIICDRYKTCAGGKCFRAVQERAGGFARYQGKEVEVVGFTSCGGCPGGNIEYSPEEMKKNGAQVIHLATGMVVGYPPCPHIEYFREFIQQRFGLEVVVGTHPIPEKYFKVQDQLESWTPPGCPDYIDTLLVDEETRLRYD